MAVNMAKHFVEMHNNSVYEELMSEFRIQYVIKSKWLCIDVRENMDLLKIWT